MPASNPQSQDSRDAPRVLLVSYYFPPSGGSGVQRALKFVKYLPDFNWQPIVLTVDPEFAAYPDLDPTMESEVPACVQIHRTKSWDPYRMYARWTGKSLDNAVTVGFLSDKTPTMRERLARWVRANVFIPDARVGWTPYAYRAAKSKLALTDFDAVITTGPPHSTHLIGRKLCKRFGIPWIADFRDPWTDIDFMEQLPMRPAIRRINERLERSVMNEANVVVAISPSMCQAYASKTNARCVTIFNGYDEEDFENELDASETDSFVISHVGNMNAARNPEPLWRVLKKLRSENSYPHLKVRLVGNVDVKVLEQLDKLELKTMVEQIEYVPHREAVVFMQTSSILLLPINRVQSAGGIVTGKLFEYLAAKKPILGLGPADGEAGRILKETGAGAMLEYDDEAGIEEFIRRAYASWESRQPFYEASGSTITRYSRRHQTGVLANLLNDLSRR